MGKDIVDKVLLGSRITYIEPVIRLILAACFLLLGFGFYLFPEYGAAWLGFALFLVIGLLGSGLTQFCLMAWSLRHLGLRSEWDELKALERAHATAQTRASYLDTLNLFNEVIVEMTPEGKLLWKSDKWAELFGNDSSQGFTKCIGGEDLTAFNDMVETLVGRKEAQAKVHFHGCTQDGKDRWLEGRFTVAQDGGAMVLRGILRDITEAYEENLANAHKATHDELTGLPNRVLFEDRLAQAKARADRKQNGLAVLFIDLDHFKQVNDRMGHHVGDEVLQSVAVALRDGVRPGDTVSRWGGDEFVALIPDLADADGARIVAEGLLDAARHKLTGEAAKIVTFSIGVAFYPAHAADINELLVKADQALYQAKAAGRDTVRYAG